MPDPTKAMRSVVITSSVDGLSFMDISAPTEGVDIQVAGASLLVYVDGVCVLRVVKIPQISLNVDREADIR